MATNFPKHPIFSWMPAIVGTVDYDDGSTSGTINLATEIGSAYWGWDSDGSDIATTASIQGKLVDLLDAALSPSRSMRHIHGPTETRRLL